MMSLDLRAIPHSPAALGALIGVGFLYGVAHAAGPGHGKAVIASYMMANELALRRGMALALFAALLQGAVAVAIVGVAALVFGATAARMNALADLLASASYLSVAALGAWLSWRKGVGAGARGARLFRPPRRARERRTVSRRAVAAGAGAGGPRRVPRWRRGPGRMRPRTCAGPAPAW